MDKPIDSASHLHALPQVARVEALRPLRWLKLGWDDLCHNPIPSLAQGLLLVLMGWLILLFCSAYIDILAAAISGFLLVGPVFAAGFMSCRGCAPPASGPRSTPPWTAP